MVLIIEQPAKLLYFFISLLLVDGSLRAQSALNPGSIDNPPNFIIIFCDDLGYADLSVFGSKINNTPNLDQMAREGVKLTNFYATASVCTPSRASIMTGCYPQRVDMAEVRESDFRSVLLPSAQHGLNPSEITLAEMLKPAGYATACIGKWHLGDQPQFLPTRQGFDTYFGVPYSNNMDGKYGLPLMRDEEVIEQPADQSTLTRRYTQEAIAFMEAHREEPFFIYLPHTMPHTPLHASEGFAGKSPHGLYSDVVEEIDWSTGEILNYLKKNGLADNTFVFFTSDNGGVGGDLGQNTPLRDGKGRTWEGGMRVPGIAWWPGTIPAGRTVDGLTTTMDFMPTYHQLVYGSPFTQQVIDGHDLFPLLTGAQDSSAYHAFYYYDRDQLQAVRSGNWKLHLPMVNRFQSHYTDNSFAISAELYNLDADVGETNNVAAEYPDIVSKLTKLANQAGLVFGEMDHPSPYVRRAGKVLEATEPRRQDK
jgi:arylsulfatase A-like enzyme